MLRFGQNPVYTVCIRYVRQGNDEIYGHTYCAYIQFWPTILVLAGGNPFSAVGVLLPPFPPMDA